jgi:ABC-type branched-subunit amino acid transport system ATPase component
VIVLDAGHVIAHGAPDVVAADQQVQARFLGRQRL